MGGDLLGLFECPAVFEVGGNPSSSECVITNRCRKSGAFHSALVHRLIAVQVEIVQTLARALTVSPRLRDQVTDLGVTPITVDVSEFLKKGGGSVKCMIGDLGILL